MIETTTAPASNSVTPPPADDNTLIVAVSVVCAVVLFVGVVVVTFLICRKLKSKHSLQYNDTQMTNQVYAPGAYPTSMNSDGSAKTWLCESWQLCAEQLEPELRVAGLQHGESAIRSCTRRVACIHRCMAARH
jgi:hypothetical protein